MTDAKAKNSARNGAAPRAHSTLDAAFLEAQRNPEASPRFFDELMATTLFMPIHDEPEETLTGGQSISPIVFEVEDEETILVFDSEERLAEWATEPVNYVGLPGAAIFEMFDGREQVGLNLGVAPSSLIITRENVEWLHERALEATQTEEVPAGASLRVEPPTEAPREAVAALTSRLAGFRAEIEEATLFRLFVEGADGRETSRLVLALAPTALGAHRADEVAAALAKTARSSFSIAEPLEVTILHPGSELLEKARNVGLRLPIIDFGSLN
ncbi:SseB family protein [Neomegalonema perideroedes]|uniref:SseB family protein n=1 Tax=Neomegalonema perideroedes TaxID=217219 RepID=UPI00037E1A32|nr:SseB family protein [Neomegalonema perideroedes]